MFISAIQKEPSKVEKEIIIGVENPRLREKEEMYKKITRSADRNLLEAVKVKHVLKILKIIRITGGEKDNNMISIFYPI